MLAFSSSEYYLYHCGNLPNFISTSLVKLFFSEAGVTVVDVIIKKEKLTKMERSKPGKDAKDKKKLIKKTTKVEHW